MAFCIVPAIIGSSRNTFITPLRYQNRGNRSIAAKRQRACIAVSSEHPGKQEEIQELMKKLQELRAKRDALREKISEETLAPSVVEQPQDIASPAVDSSAIKIGRHGEKSRFMSFSTISGDEYYPRAVVLLSSDATPTQVLEAPSMGGAPKPGKLVTSTIPAGFNGRLVSLQFTGKLVELMDPICLSLPPKTVADNLPKDLESDVIVVVERAIENEEFEKTKFYIWGDGDKVRIGWAAAKPSELKCLGRVVCAFLEEPPERRKAKSAWEEENEVYM